MFIERGIENLDIRFIISMLSKGNYQKNLLYNIYEKHSMVQAGARKLLMSLMYLLCSFVSSSLLLNSLF